MAPDRPSDQPDADVQAAAACTMGVAGVTASPRSTSWELNPTVPLIEDDCACSGVDRHAITASNVHN
ncbi:hypothetical protein GCM10010872_13940 [Dyella flava]|nr:hypothetical protein GCM10010872_13940 [Dyella flava]